VWCERVQQVYWNRQAVGRDDDDDACVLCVVFVCLFACLACCHGVLAKNRMVDSVPAAETTDGRGGRADGVSILRESVTHIHVQLGPRLRGKDVALTYVETDIQSGDGTESLALLSLTQVSSSSSSSSGRVTVEDTQDLCCAPSS